MAGKDDAWFEIVRIRGKVTTVPVKAIGVVAIAAILLAPVGLSLFVVPILIEFHFAALAAWMALMLALAFLAVFALVKAKSRER